MLAQLYQVIGFPGSFQILYIMWLLSSFTNTKWLVLNYLFSIHLNLSIHNCNTIILWSWCWSLYFIISCSSIRLLYFKLLGYLFMRNWYCRCVSYLVHRNIRSFYQRQFFYLPSIPCSLIITSHWSCLSCLSCLGPCQEDQVWSLIMPYAFCLLHTFPWYVWNWSGLSSVGISITLWSTISLG